MQLNMSLLQVIVAVAFLLTHVDAEESELFDFFNTSLVNGYFNETLEHPNNISMTEVVELMVKSATLEVIENKTEIKEIRQQLEKRPVRVVSLIEEPFVNYYLNETEKQQNKKFGPGLVMEILREFQKKYAIKYEFVTPKSHLWGDQNSNGSWNGLIRMLLENEADILAGAVIVRSDRSAVVDYTVAFSDGTTGVLIRAPDKFVDKKFMIFAKPFRWEVWLMVVAFIVVTGVLLKFITQTLEDTNEVQFGTIGSLWVFYSVFLQQGLPVQPNSWTCRTLLAIWWLGALTLVATFTGNMVALFAVEKIKFPFNDDAEFVSHVVDGSYKVVMTNSSLTRFLFLKDSKVQLYKQLWSSLTNDGKLIWVNNVREGIEMVKRRPNLALLASKESLDLAAAIDCNVVVLNIGIIPVWQSLALQKDSQLTKYFSDLIQHMIEQGFIVKWMGDSIQRLIKAQNGSCHSQDMISTKRVAIDLSEVQGAFWLLIAGVLLAGSFLLTEYLMRLWMKISWKNVEKAEKQKMSDYNHTDTIPMRRKSSLPDLLDFPHSFDKAVENGYIHRRYVRM